MAKLIKTSLGAAGLAVALTFSSGVMADNKSHKHYGDQHFNGHYDDRNSRYSNHQYRQPTYGRIVRARVTDVDPVYEIVRGQPVAEEQCWTERNRRASRSDRRAGSVLGAVIGGVIGYKTGGKHRHNRRSGAAVGAVLGSVIGNEAAKGNRRSETHCETVYTGGYERRQLVGYNVKYKYKGQRFETFMDYEPGRYIDVRLTAEPIRR